MADPLRPAPTDPRYGPSDRVRVRNRFDGAWCAGFEVADVVDSPDRTTRYALRRTSDGVVLPKAFGEDDLVAAD